VGERRKRAAAAAASDYGTSAEPADSGFRGSPIDPAPPERSRVLIVDDDERNLLALREVLEDLAEVVTATSGEEALRHLLKGEFAVILLDVYMPVMDGYETASIIRSRDQSKRIPIVFLSAVNKETEHLIRGYSMGAVDYVFKPVEPIVLRSKVAVFVDLDIMTREIRRKAEQEQQLLDANLKANAERLRAERALRRAEQRQGAIIASLPIILYLEAIDASPRVPKFVSGNFASLTGFEFADIEAQPTIWHDRLHPDDRERVAQALAGRGGANSFAVEYRWRCADGQYKHFLDQAVLLRGARGEPLEYAGTLLDVTERKHLESQLVQAGKMDAIGKLTGGIAHDFNNLLAAMLGGIGLIERRMTLNEEQAKILAMTRHAAEQGSELVGRLLAFARRQTLEPAAIEMAGLAEAVRDLLAHTLGGLVELDWQADPDLWSPFADEAQLELALMNVIINARDAMPNGGTIRIHGENRTIGTGVGASDDLGLPAGDYVMIAVTDTGCGIAPDMVEQVMEPFFTTKEVGKGTGLGLSMVYGFARQSGGAIRIASHVGEGTRVELWLPRAPEASLEDRAADMPEARAAAIAPPSAGLNVLLVDDHQGVRATTAAMLEDLGHTVTQAGDGPEMLDLLKEDPDSFDLIISDYAMPRLSGAEVVHQAREIRPEMPAILITGYADSRSIARRPEDVHVLAKPFTPEQMCAAIGGAAAGKTSPPRAAALARG
jgi:PAS domain S-box-containing protein